MHVHTHTRQTQHSHLHICLHWNLNIILETEDWGMPVLTSTCGWLMSVGSSPCCGVRGQVQWLPTPATSWKTWTSPTWSWWVSSAHYFPSCQRPRLSIQNKYLCLCASVTQDIQNNMDYIGCCIFFDNDWNLHFVLVSRATVHANQSLFYKNKNKHLYSLTHVPWFLCRKKMCLCCRTGKVWLVVFIFLNLHT